MSVAGEATAVVSRWISIYIVPVQLSRGGFNELSFALGSTMASKACIMRLQKEYSRLQKEPLPDVVAEPRCATTASPPTRTCPRRPCHRPPAQCPLHWAPTTSSTACISAASERVASPDCVEEELP